MFYYKIIVSSLVVQNCSLIPELYHSFLNYAISIVWEKFALLWFLTHFFLQQSPSFS